MDFESIEDEPGAAGVWLKRVAMVIAVAVVVGLIGLMIKSFMKDTSRPKKTITEVRAASIAKLDRTKKDGESIPDAEGAAA